MGSPILKRLLGADAYTLGVVRAIVHGVFLVSVLCTDFSALGRLPVTLLRPIGVMQLLPWPLYDALLTPRGMLAFKVLLTASLALGTLGLWTRAATKTSFLLVLFYQGLLRSFGHFNHDEMIAVYFLAVLACAPCGDAFSLDSRRAKSDAPPARWVYAYPVLLMQILLAWAYFSSALLKLRTAGLAYFSADNLPTLAILHSLDNLHETEYRYAFLLPEYRAYTAAAVTVVFAWELLFPLAVFSRRARWPLLGFGVLFHVATRYLLNVFFPFFLAMYVVFIDWTAVAERLRGLRRRAKSSG